MSWSVRLCLLAPLCWSAVGLHAAEALIGPDRPIAEVIDHYLDARLAQEKIAPAPEASPETVVRRLTLDLAGRIPTPSEVRAYLSDPSSDKRARLVERLLNSSAAIEHQVNELDVLIMTGRGSLREYLTPAVKENRPWDQIFRDVVAGDYQTERAKGAQEFLKQRVKDLDQLTNDVSVVFFGVNISCAQCHDHPLVADWKQDHFFGLKSFLNRTYENGGFIGERDYGNVSFLTPKGESRNARLMFLSGQAVNVPAAPEPDNKAKKAEQDRLKELATKKQPPPPPSLSLRSKLVDTALQAQERDRFARSMVNRVWHRLMGHGLVMPVDQMHSGNPPSHPELLDWLARDTIAHQYDLQRLMRGIVQSRAYARSSRWDRGPLPDASLFAVGPVRPLTPAQMGFSLRLAMSDPQLLAETNKPEEVEKRLQGLQGAGRGLAGNFPPPSEHFQVSVTESLLFSNGPSIAKDLLSEGGDRLLSRLKSTSEPEARVELATWNVWGRAPDAEERRLLVDYLKQRHDRPADANQQLVWILLTSAEFRFNY